MAEGKRYYWLRLKEDFFESKRIKKLRKIAGGDTYTIIYLKMQLKAIKTNGILKFTGLETNFAEELALDLDEDVENVKVTLAFLQQCGLVETADNVNFELPFVIENIGSETASTQRVREFRERQKVLQCNANVTQMKQLCNGEKESIVRKKKEDIDKSACAHAHTHARGNAYGSHNNIFLSEKEYEDFKSEYPDYEKRIERMSEYCYKRNRQYSNCYEHLKLWAEQDKAKSPTLISESFDFDEFFNAALKRGVST